MKALRCPVCGWWVWTSGVSLLSVSVYYIFMPNVVVNTILQLEKQKNDDTRIVKALVVTVFDDLIWQKYGLVESSSGCC